MYYDLFRSLSLTTHEHPHESIRESIEMILNARRGSLPFASLLGVPDFMDSMISDYRNRLKSMVLNQIQANEPRIKTIACDSNNEKNSLASTRYEMHVILRTEERVDVRIETTGSGKFHVYL